MGVYLPNCSDLGVVVLKKINRLGGPLSGSITPGRELSSLLLLCLVIDGEYGSEQ